MNLEKIESLIDKAIEDEDFEKLLELLDERERILKSSELDSETIRSILERDEERMRKIERMKEELVRTAFKSEVFKRHLESYRKSQRGRSWGRG